MLLPKPVSMKITFGQALDGTELWAVNNSIGDVVCGLLRLTEILETQLGLKRKSVSEITRVFQFVKVLEKLAENKPRFYSTSFKKDPLAVSEALLNWRDSLALAGWTGMIDGGSPFNISSSLNWFKKVVKTPGCGCPDFGGRLARFSKDSLR